MTQEEKIRLDTKNEEPIITEFMVNLNGIGVFPRAYDAKSRELYEAARIVHKHLCTLDTGYYTPAREVKLLEFANAYAEVHNGLRKLE